MFKKGLQTVCLLFFCLLSFFYTEKVVTVVKNQDPIMIKLNEVATTYQLPSTNAIINNNDITPGQNGCQINIEKSYLKMKKVGSYQPKLLYYEELKPKISLSNTYDKY